MSEFTPLNETQLLDDQIRNRLELARESLQAAGFYAYIMLDEHQRWCVAADDEAGRIDITVKDGDYVVELWNSSPGLYVEEESEWRRNALERLARRVVPNISQGMLLPNQEATWSQEDHGVAVRSTHRVSFERAMDIGALCRSELPVLEELLTYVERQVVS